MARDALGVKSIDRKAKAVEVKPPEGVPLEWCEGSVPVSATEAVSVSWRKDGGAQSLKVDLPPGWRRR